MSVDIVTPEVDFQIFVAGTCAAEAGIEDRVKAVWAEECLRRDSTLFDGPIYSVAALAPSCLHVWRSSYRYFLAQRRDPALAPFLAVRPLVVSGLLVCPDGVVLGRRGYAVEQDPGLWELAPAGSVEGCETEGAGPPDPLRQLMIELEEELGLTVRNLLVKPELFAIASDRAARVVDMAYCLRTTLRADEIRRLFVQQHREYCEIRILKLREVSEALIVRSVVMSAASAAIVRTAERTGHSMLRCEDR